MGDTGGCAVHSGVVSHIEKFRGKDVLFAPGGLGLAPLRSLINQVIDERALFGRVIILYGARNPSEMLFKEELQEWGQRADLELHVTVDRGDENLDWQRRRDHHAVQANIDQPAQYGCDHLRSAGDVPFVLMELLGKGISNGNIYLSLERHMKCGVGKCGHCQINNVYACQSGPVFPYSEIMGMEEAL